MQKLELHGDELDSRAREVLREIIMQHVATGEAISSRSLAKCGRFELSPASLRNVMADLEDLGYLHQPHTSAGRVPTDRGYRFFIDHLMRSRALTSRERDAIDERVRSANEIDEVLQATSRLLSHFSDQVGVVFMPTLLQFAIRSMDFILVGENKIMCVIVGTNGVVVNKVVESSRYAFTREELEKISRYISGEFSGMTLDAIRRRLIRMTEEERAQHDEMLQKTISLGIVAVNDVAPVEHELYVEGTTSILMKPEYADAASLRKTMMALQEREKLIELLNSCLNQDALQIIIGSETDFTQVHNFSIVARRYGSQSPLGMVGIIGPMRMEYARMAPLVDYLSRALSRKIEEQEQQQ